MKCIVLVLFLSVAVSRATEEPIAQHPQRTLILKSLQSLVDETGKEEENHFFARRLNQEDWIFWREGRLLMPITFDVAVADQEVSAAQIWAMRVRYCRKPINLDSGVVPTRSDLPAGTTYHVTRDYVANIVYDSVLNGELIVMKKNPNLAAQAPERLRPSESGPLFSPK